MWEVEADRVSIWAWLLWRANVAEEEEMGGEVDSASS